MKKLSVVGIGPGNEVYSSIEARETLEGSDLIIGYKKYVELVEEYLPDKEYLYTGMTKEVDRCKMALEKACEGLSVAVVCSGDAGVYGMAGLVYELSSDYPDVEINVVQEREPAVGHGDVIDRYHLLLRTCRVCTSGWRTRKARTAEWPGRTWRKDRWA